MEKCDQEIKRKDKEDLCEMTKLIVSKRNEDGKGSDGKWKIVRGTSLFSGTWFYCFVIIIFISFVFALTFLFATVSILKCKLQLVQEVLNSQFQVQEELIQLFGDLSVGMERGDSLSTRVPLFRNLMPIDSGSVEIGMPRKRKREISTGEENATAGVPNGNKLSTLSSSISYENLENFSSNHFDRPRRMDHGSTTPKSRRSRRKPKKYHRHHVSAEKFFTELESTTSTPIQVRQSRTKQTESAEKGKHKQALHHKPLLQVFASKESITREEALRRQFASRNLIPENVALFSKSGNDTFPDAPVKLADSITYNMITVHYAADTSNYSRERDLHYFGNGRMQMKTSVYRDWKPVHWTQGIQVTKYFNLNQGMVTVSLTGIYLIYAQVQYSNVQEVNGYSVVCNKQVIVQCITTSIHPDKDEVKSNTCDTSTTILLHENDRIYLQDLHHGRHVVLTPEKSYFGLILLSPFKGN